MTTKESALHTHLPFPDPPERRPEDMSTFNHLTINGNVYLLAKYLGKQETTIVAGEHYIAAEPTRETEGIRYPDLFIAFNADPQAYRESNSYIISQQGKLPDFFMEIASRSTGRTDTREKRVEYAALGIPEYWRFDETGRYNRTRLAGDRLVNQKYEPIPIEEIESGILRGYSGMLNLFIRWEHGQLVWHDPDTGRPIPTFDDERARADGERSRAEAAEARVQELEAELARRDRQD